VNVNDVNNVSEGVMIDMDLRQRLDKELYHDRSISYNGASAIGVNPPSYSDQRRDFLKTIGGKGLRTVLGVAAGGLIVDYAISNLPRVFGKGEYSEFDCGTVITVPTFDGTVGPSWYGDTNDYVSTGTPIISSQNNQPMECHLRTKFDDQYTWFGVDIPTNTKTQGPNLDFIFDPDNTGITKHGAIGIYNLELSLGANGMREGGCFYGQSDPSGSCFAGTPFSKAFPNGRGTVYDWRYAFVSSPLNSSPHPQFNVKIETEILRKSDAINAYFGYSDSLGIAWWNSGNYGKLKFVDQALPESGAEPGWREVLEGLGIGAALTTAAVVNSQKKVSRRDAIFNPLEALR
jgi:hypothetical protein